MLCFYTVAVLPDGWTEKGGAPQRVWRWERGSWWKRGNNLIGIKIAFLAMKKLLQRIMIFFFHRCFKKMMKSQRHFFYLYAFNIKFSNNARLFENIQA